MSEKTKQTEEQEAYDIFMASNVNLLRNACFEASQDAGWHNDIVTGKPLTEHQTNDLFPTRIALIHSEASEALEGFRKGLMDSHLPHRENAEVELADLVIRVMDLSGAMGYDIGGAIMEKIEYNRKRADHKIENRKAENGKKF